MPLIHDPDQVQELYRRAAGLEMCLANFCTSNPYTTEAIVRSSFEFAHAHGIHPAPIVVSATGHYPIEPQLPAYTGLNSAALGMHALIDDLEMLLSEASPYAGVPVMLHLDHGQPGADAALFEAALGRYATVMYDASDLALEDNIQATRTFVKRMAGRILVEGAVAEVGQASALEPGTQDAPLTTPQAAVRFLEETGVFLIVPDLGTEHRATNAVAQYDGERAREIAAQVGVKMVLHGSSSLPDAVLGQLCGDGIAKVNVWTTFERVGGQAVARQVLAELGNMLPQAELEALREAGILGPKFFEAEYISSHFGGSISPKLGGLRESGRRAVWSQTVVERMTFYLEHFGYGRWQ